MNSEINEAIDVHSNKARESIVISLGLLTKNGTNHHQSISSNSYTGMLGLPGVASARVELAGMAGPEEFKVVGVSSSWSFSSLLMQ